MELVNDHFILQEKDKNTIDMLENGGQKICSINVAMNQSAQLHAIRFLFRNGIIKLRLTSIGRNDKVFFSTNQ